MYSNKQAIGALWKLQTLKVHQLATHTGKMTVKIAVVLLLLPSACVTGGGQLLVTD